MIMDRLYGGVCYAGIDVDPELKYPKGAGRVAFSNQQSYIAAISARFVQLQHGDIDKRVSERRLSRFPFRSLSLSLSYFPSTPDVTTKLDDISAPARATFRCGRTSGFLIIFYISYPFYRTRLPDLPQTHSMVLIY